MIRIEDVYKSIDGNAVIRGVSLDVTRGEVLALIGKSGTGKSVLLKHIPGLIKPDRGHITINGTNIGKLSNRKLMKMRRQIGFLFQGGALFDSMTVYDNVAFPLRENSKIKEEAIREKVMDGLLQVGLTGAEEKYPAELSGGMKKRAALARELIWEPEIMLFDEPASGLDPIMRNAILHLIKKLHERLRFTGILVSHEIPQVFEITDRVAMLHDGVITAVGTPEEILSSANPIVNQLIKGDREGPISVH